MKWNIGTWNVRSLYKPGIYSELKEEVIRSGIDVLAIQETRWPGSGYLEQRDFTLFHSSSNKRNELGTAFLVRKTIRKHVINFEPINERISTIRLRGKFHNISLINVYGPTEEKDDNIKDEFYDKIMDIATKQPRHDLILILGDLNAKIGKERIYQPTIGINSLHEESNNNGTRTIELATSLNMTIASTMFPHKNIHKGTWTSPDGNTTNQIDHVLVKTRYKTNIEDVRSYRGPNIDSDHYLVRVKIKLRVAIAHDNNKRKERRHKWNLDRLTDEETKTKYVNEIKQRLAKQRIDGQERTNDPGNKWSYMKQAIEESASNVLKEKERTTRNNWFDDECKAAIREKNEARKRMLQRKTRANERTYKENRTECNKILRRKKREELNKQIKEMEENGTKGNTRSFYQSLKCSNYNRKQSNKLIKDKEGKLLVSKEKALERWKEYFHDMLNNNEVNENDNEEEPNTRNNPEPTTTEPDEPTQEEVDIAINKLKKFKAAGDDEIPAELIKAGGEELRRLIHELITDIWKEERMPQEWATGLIVPIFKKGDMFDCNNYRGISLLCTAYKVLATILYERLKPYTENTTGEYQSGFRTNRSTIDHIFTIKQIMEKNWEYNIETYYLFIDFKKAYDSIKRKELWKIMEEQKIPGKLIRLIKATADSTLNKVKLGQDKSEIFETKDGIRQGDALAPQLFNIALEKAVREAKLNRSGNIFVNAHQILAFADDVVIISRNKDELEEAFKKLEKAAREVGLQINEEKSKLLITAKKQQIGNENWEIDEYTFQRVDNFVYLGSVLNRDNNTSEEIRRRIIQGNKSYYSNMKIMKSKAVSQNTKLRIYKTLIKPVVTYGSETWTLTKEDERTLHTFERKILRKVYGPTLEEEGWRIKYNQELYDLYQNPNIVATIKSNRLRWLGHIKRMDEQRLPRRILQGNPRGARSRGRPKNRWMDQVLRDITNLGITNWTRAVQNRPEWKNIVEDAKLRLGA